jgi:rod shape-determining protein MreB and related proteins
VAGRDLVAGLLWRVAIDAGQVREALGRKLAHIVAPVKDLLERTPAELSSDITDRGLTLVGGGALLPGFDELLRHDTGLAVAIADSPLETVARGARAALEVLEALDRDARPRRRRQV